MIHIKSRVFPWIFCLQDNSFSAGSVALPSRPPMQGHRIQGSDLDCFALEFPKIFIRVLFNFIIPLLTTTTTKNKLPLTRRIQKTDIQRLSTPTPTKSSLTTTLPTRLIATGCPARSDVSLRWDEGSSNSAFSFKVSSNIKSKVGKEPWGMLTVVILVIRGL